MSIRRHRPIGRLTPQEAHETYLERIFVKDDQFYYFIRLASGKHLRVWPWRTFRCIDWADAEYMRLKLIAMAERQELPPLDFGYDHFDPEKYKQAYEEWQAEKRSNCTSCPD